ncbi:MAG TPA: flavin reductase family protein [Candidatus Thalassarchaeaceae archaeon]|nr:flavin reductase family protein [Candidatus Thalassarchaeaceae archaeon]
MNNDSKQNVIQFLERCIVYADESIQRKKERGGEDEEISRWQAYRDFTAHASEEISRGELDDWFDSGDEISLELGSEVINLEEMSHQERTRWLSAIISPRPLVLVSTISSNGEPNLAPMSSVSVISNTPPLIGMSLSSNREGRPRDTLLNLKETRKATLAILPSNEKSAQIIEKTATPLPRGESEWSEIEAVTTIEGGVTVPGLAIAAIETTLVECHPLPLGSVAEWVILSVDSIIKPSSSNIEDIESSSILAQIANNLLGGIQSTSWNQKIQDFQSN